MSKNSETHAVCNKHNIGGKSVCCECSGKTDCSNDMPSQQEIERIVEEFERGGWHITDIDKCRKFIADVRTTLTSLTEAHKVEMEKAQKEIAHLSNYAQHDIQCITIFEEDEKCDCGLVNIEVK